MDMTIPFRPIAEPEEIAEAGLFFLSGRADLRHRAGPQRQPRPDDGRLTA